MISDYNIRWATPTDAKPIALCHIESWQKIYRGLIPDSILDNLSLEDREQRWYQLLSNNARVLVLENNFNIIGFASIGAVRDVDQDSNHAGEINAIYLHPNVWRKGLGKQLCLAALAELEVMGFDKVIVWVLKENKPAISFYQALGFIEASQSKSVPYHHILLHEVQYIKSFTA